MARAKITKANGRTAVVLPDELAEKFRLGSGGTVYIRETGRGFEVSAMTPGEENDLRQAQESLRQYKQNWRYAGG
ncbi:MAG: hypothetical protein ACMVY4_07750 [Minwuia sp.]|uniref:hypothetical protein n=1 Tax=Minwuia sp. TaxID=2493630 RepID=UPI003A89EE0B